MKYEYVKLPFNNPLVPCYFIIKYSGCCCQLCQMLQQVLASAYGLNPMFQVSGFKRKFQIINKVWPVVNAKNTFIIQALCAQSKIKYAIAFLKKLNDCSGCSVEKMVQYGGKQLKTSDLAISAKGSTISEPKKCSCSDEGMITENLNVSSKKEQLMIVMYYSPYCADIIISGNKVTVKTYEKIKGMTKGQAKRFVTQIEKVWPGHDSVLWKWQGLQCGYFF